MTFKAGDTIELPFKLQNIFGQALTYASLAAAQADGWSIAATMLGLATSITVQALVPDPTQAGLPTFDGTHLATVVLPGPGVILGRMLSTKSINGGGTYLPPQDLLLVVPAADTDSLSAQLTAGVGIPIAGGTVVTVADLNVIEGDALYASFTVLASQLNYLIAGANVNFATLADVSATSWTIACEARYPKENGQLPGQPLAFTLTAAVISKTLNQIAIGWTTPPATALVDDIPATLGAVTVVGQAVTAIAISTPGHYYGTNVPTVVFSGGGGSGAAATAIISNGQLTGFTITSPGANYTSAPTASLVFTPDGTVMSRQFKVDIQLLPPSASPATGCKTTVFSFNLNILRQQTTSP